ncbi:MAG: ribokinase [Clostridia bacterium]|nr:ribokinase [Clostridia bacterium]
MKVYNLGSLNVDYVYSVDHFVSAGETVASYKLERHPGGKGLNQSVAIARAGGTALHGALIGDGAGFLRDQLNDSGVDTSFMRREDGDPGHAIIQVDRNGENCIMLFAGTNRKLDRDYVKEFLSGASEGDILLAQNETNCIGEAFDEARSKGMKIAFNPSPFDDEIKNLPLGFVDLWFCNEIEGAALTGVTDPDAMCDEFIKMFPKSALVLTLGEEGSVYCDLHGKVRQSAYKANAVDTTAAGDTFTGYFLANLSKGVEFALDIASRASSVTVSRMGASSSIPYYDEL